MPEKAIAERDPHEQAEPSLVPPRPGARVRAASSAQVIIAMVAVLAVCYFAKLVLVILLISILLAFVLAPVVDLMTRFRTPRSLGALIAVLLLAGAVFG